MISANVIFLNDLIIICSLLLQLLIFQRTSLERDFCPTKPFSNNRKLVLPFSSVVPFFGKIEMRFSQIY